MRAISRCLKGSVKVRHCPCVVLIMSLATIGAAGGSWWEDLYEELCGVAQARPKTCGYTCNGLDRDGGGDGGSDIGGGGNASGWGLKVDGTGDGDGD